jgi:hypothetical protein
MEIPVQRHPCVNLLAKITMGAWLCGAKLLTPAVAGAWTKNPHRQLFPSQKRRTQGRPAPARSKAMQQGNPILPPGKDARNIAFTVPGGG